MGSVRGGAEGLKGLLQAISIIITNFASQLVIDMMAVSTGGLVRNQIEIITKAGLAKYACWGTSTSSRR
jgi:hypothetical protein